MCLFVEEKEKSAVFSFTYKYYETAYTVFSTLSNPTPPIIPTPSIIQDSRVYYKYATNATNKSEYVQIRA